MAFQCIYIYAHPLVHEGVGFFSPALVLALASGTLVCSLLGFLSVGRLLKVHLFNFLTGRTSSERFSRTSMIGSRFFKFSARNFIAMCCNFN